jgi:UDP-N-acetylglucosamine:LPS N-acetylglucosamine transferase
MEAKRVCFLITDAGGGHRSIARALRDAIAKAGYDWDVKIVNFYQDIIPSTDGLHRRLGIWSCDIYNKVLLRYQLGGQMTRPFIAGLQRQMRQKHVGAVALTEHYWRNEHFDLVVSMMPYVNDTVAESITRACPEVPVVTLVTDYDEWLPNVWFQEGNQIYICGTSRLERQGEEHHVPPSRMVRVSGLVVHPDFYRLPEQEIEEGRVALGLDPRRPVGLVMFGAYGARALIGAGRELSQSRPDIQLIFVCGHNRSLRARIETNGSGGNVALGFTNELPYYMRLADFFVGKPGAVSVTEALVAGLPVITHSNWRTMPQERYVADWIEEEEVGLKVQTLGDLGSAASTVLDNADAYHDRLSALGNRAVFEVPHILSQVMAGSTPA